MTDADTNSSRESADHVAAALKAAFTALGDADIAAEEKARWHQRLLAVTNMSKRDVVRAREQLDHFDEEWNARMRGKDEREDGTDR